MRHENSVFHSITKHIPWSTFDRLVDRHRSDYRVRRLDSKSQFLAMLFAQLSGAQSLREIEAGLASHANQLYHLGAKRAARSTLAEANTNRTSAVFEDLFTEMVAVAGRRTRRKLANVTRILDATRFELSSLHSGWTVSCNGKWAAKLHVVYDPNDDVPLKADITPETVNDITPAKALTPEPGATYVFDLAYYDFAWWAKLNALGCRIVTRLKSHTELHHIAVLSVSDDGDIVSDRIGLLP